MRKPTLAALLFCSTTAALAQSLPQRACNDDWSYRDTILEGKQVCLNKQWTHLGPDRIFLNVTFAVDGQKTGATFIQLDRDTTQAMNKHWRYKPTADGTGVSTIEAVRGHEIGARIWVTPDKKLSVTVDAKLWLESLGNTQQPSNPITIREQFIVEQGVQTSKTLLVNGRPVELTIEGAVDKDWGQRK